MRPLGVTGNWSTLSQSMIKVSTQKEKNKRKERIKEKNKRKEKEGKRTWKEIAGVGDVVVAWCGVVSKLDVERKVDLETTKGISK
jgi:hypothetical protein